MGEAFDAACQELHDTGQFDAACQELHDTGQEVMAKRIVKAAERGERDIKRLRDAALTALRGTKRA
jgi:hypothetical protein